MERERERDLEREISLSIQCSHRPKEAMAAIRKRLTGNTKNFHIINLTLTVSIRVALVHLHNVYYCAPFRYLKPVSKTVEFDSIPR